MTRRRRAARVHFALTHIEASVRRPVAPVVPAQPTCAGRPYWVRHGISKVFGASPAIVFDPPGPIASIIKRKRMPNKGWIKIQAILNGEADIIRGYDDGEAMPQSRGIHAY